MPCMKQIIMKLRELSDQIGNGAAVSVNFRPRPPISPEIAVRVDWPNKFHFEHLVPFDDVMNDPEPDKVLDFVVYNARQKYEENNRPTI